MSVTININCLTLVHRGSGGVSHNTLPDVCKTPKKGKPKPFDNEAYSKDLDDGTSTVFADGGNMIGNFGSIFATSVLDEGGKLGGIISGTHLAEADFITHSFDVFFEGRPCCRWCMRLWSSSHCCPATWATRCTGTPWTFDSRRAFSAKVCRACI